MHSKCYIQSSGSNKVERFGVPPMQGQIYKELLRKPGPMFQGLLVSKEALGPLDETIVSYQEWDTAIRLANLRRAAEGNEQVFTKHLWSIFCFLGPNALAWHYQTAAGLYFKAGDENNAHRCLRRAFLFSPFRPKTILSRVQRLIRSNI